MICEGLRAVDLSSGIAGGYCSKLLADLGFDVVKLEPADGDPLRVQRPELFAYLHTSQRSVVADLDGGGDARPWVESADVVIESFTPGVLEDMGLLRVAPVTVSLSPFGRGGPDSTLMLPEEVLQARSGSLSNHGHMDRPPLTLGGNLGEYVTGAFGALGAVTAWRRFRRAGVREHVDVSMLEAMQLTMVTVPTLFSRFPGGHLATFRWVMIPGNEPCRDGNFAGVTTVTKAQWLSLLRVVGREDLMDDGELTTMLGRFKRAKEVNELLHAFTMARAAEEVVEACAAERVPAAVVGNGELLPTFEQLRARHVFVRQPGERWVRPRAPFRFSAVPDRVMTPAPRLGEHSAETPPSRLPEAAEHRNGGAGPRERPLTGIRVLDFTAFWSGPCATAWFVSMGAEVIKVESIQRPDGIRFSAAVRPQQDERYYEMCALFHAVNLGKRGITLDLGSPSGLAIARRLIERCDVVIENFTPRVMDGFGLDYEAVRAIKPDVVYLRLPAFGLSGPWRDRPGFAQTMEQLTGMAWVTGYEGGPPIIPGGFVDPSVGMHTATALVAALEHRDRTGEGQLVETPMIEVAAAMTAEQVIEWSAHERVTGRRGERGVYRCEGDDQWVAVDLGADPMAGDARAAWCAPRSAELAVKELAEAGIAAAAMVPAFATLDDRQLRARRFFQRIDHPIVGEHEYPGWPARFASLDGPGDWWPGRAPMLGEHTDQVLREVGVTDAELARLRAEGVIGTAPVAT